MHPSIKRSLHIARSGILCLVLAATASCGSIDWYIDHEGRHSYDPRFDADTIQQIRQDLHGKGIQHGTGVAVRYGHRLSLEVSVWYSSNHELVHSGPIEFTYKNNPYWEYGSHVKDFDAFSVFPFGLYGMRVGGSREFSINHTCSPGHVITQASCLLFMPEMAGRNVEVRNNDGLNVTVTFKSSCTPITILVSPLYGKPGLP